MDFPQEEFDRLTSGLTYSATFVPFSESRNRGEKRPSLNWRVSLARNGITYETDYSQGIGCLSERDKAILDKTAKPGATSWRYQNELKIAETGKIFRDEDNGKPIDSPLLRDIVHSLLLDSDAIDYASFEDWASSFGYDSDSRAAEATYNACVATGLKMRLMFGDQTLVSLRELFQDY